MSRDPNWQDYRRKFRSQTSDIIWTDGKSRRRKSQRREEKRREEKKRRRKKKEYQRREEKRKSQKKEDEGARKGRKVAKRCLGAPEARKVGSLKQQVRSNLVRWQMKNCTPLWCEADFEVKMLKTPHTWSSFGSWDVQKVHGAVVPKHIWKSKCKNTAGSALLEVEMLKKCTAVWREAHFEVKSVKNWRSRATFGGWDAEKVHGDVARSTFRSQNVQSTPLSEHFWKLRCWKCAGVVAQSTCPSQSKSTTCSDHFWTFQQHLVWQAQWVLHLVKSEPNVWVL